MLHDVKKSVWDAAETCQRIQAFTTGKTLETYLTDLQLRLTVERLFEILGEAFKRIEGAAPSFRDAVPEMGKIIGMRNRLIHGYDRVDHVTVWDAVQVHVPVLAAKLAAWLKENG